MAVLRPPTDLQDTVNFVGTIAIFCCISCVIIMLRFKFKAILNISTQDLNHGDVPTGTMNGGYRSQREEYFGVSSYTDTRVKITPSMVKLPTNSGNDPMLRPAKSTNDLNKTDFKPVTPSKSTPDISLDPRGGNYNMPNSVKHGIPEKSTKELKKEEKERKKLAKQQIAEQKARRKANQDQAKLEAKKNQDRAKLAAKKANHLAKIEAKKAQDQAKIEAKKAKQQVKTSAIDDQRKTQLQSPTAGGSMQQARVPASTSTSSASNRPVSTISDFNSNNGPPPYSEIPINAIRNVQKNERDDTGNTSFSKPIDSSSSWDMISQHRQQITRPTASVGATSRKQIVMDLQYRRENDDDPDNSEA